MTKTRAITALALLPVVAIPIQVGGWLFCVLLAAMVSMAIWEFVHMMRRKAHQPHLLFSLPIALLALFALQEELQRFFVPGLMLLFILSLIYQLFRTNSNASMVDWALTIAPALYIGLGMGHLLALRFLPDPSVTGWVWLALFTTWGTDTFAYFIGKNFGKRKFFERISPKKTWAGYLGGVLGGATFGIIVGSIAHINLMHAIIVGLLVSLIAPFGDLSVSMMKRYAEVKDSSHLFPGHGGMLDRMDSVLFSVVVVYYYAIWIVF